MTREDAVKIAWTKEIEDFVLKIYNDRKVEVCEFCEYCLDESSQYICTGATDIVWISNIETFGCNQFKKKENYE